VASTQLAVSGKVIIPAGCSFSAADHGHLHTATAPLPSKISAAPAACAQGAAGRNHWLGRSAAYSRVLVVAGPLMPDDSRMCRTGQARIAGVQLN
jgi:hypothetical protein